MLAKENVFTTEKFLIEHGKSRAISFHMPGHKGSEFYVRNGHGEFLKHIMSCDITEIRGADNLFHANGILERTAEAYSNMYHVSKSYLLVNGTSGGILAAILGSVSRGGKLIMARNCHKSVYNALRMGNIKAEYVYPSIIDDINISGDVRVSGIEAAMKDAPDAEAVILPSPNYYGVCSNIKAIADVVHRENKILIVDQAHGAHLKMMENTGSQPMSAETSGADIVINSTHKTLASFTQTAILNVNSERVNLHNIEDKLQMVESSSPSYLLMGSLDINRLIIEEQGEKLFEGWQHNIDWFYGEARQIPGIEILDMGELHDKTKINIDASDLGLTGIQLEEKLLEQGIYIELSTGNMVMCMTGIGTTYEHLNKLLIALRRISHNQREYINSNGSLNNRELRINRDEPVSTWNKKRDTWEVIGERELVNLGNATGCIAACNIVPYPPGVPLICQGEIIGQDDAEYLKYLNSCGNDILGLEKGNKVYVIKENKTVK